MSDPGRAQRSLTRLLQIMRQLRDPQRGCPWDREQDFESIAPSQCDCRNESTGPPLPVFWK